MSRRSAAGRPASSRRGTARRRSSSATGGESARSPTATGSGRPPSRSRATGSSPSPREAGAIPLAPEETVRRGRLGPGELLLVDPGRGLILEDAEAKAHLLRRLPIHDAPRADRTSTRSPGDDDSSLGLDGAADRAPTCGSSPGSTPRTPGSTSGRWPSRATSRSGAWATTRRRPGLGRIDRPIADHLRQSFAQVTNPPIDPERERAVMDLRVELGRRPALLGGPPPRSRTLRLERPFLADLPALLRRVPPGRSAGSTRRGRRSTDRPASATALDRLAAEAVAAARGRTELLVLSDRGLRRSTACRSRRSSPPARSTPR